ncbi:MAG: FAD-dependent oxidoreductase [Clostridiales bacterium]|jgi:2,4-dienoyl-CoA reductase-like NADH-dependent reductase (Old Yellow Enzyme family)/thioredoxin reductase|nr:FAD-dependent oxidoreductase [Clostridiales bacterium]
MQLFQPINVGKITLKNRVMFPPLTTGYEERDGSIGEKSLNFYKRLAEGGVGYIVIGDVTPIQTISPTPKLFDDNQIPSYKKLADAVHTYGAKLGLQLFHPEYDVDAVNALFRQGDMQGARAKLHHDMLHFVDEVSVENLRGIIKKIAECAKRAEKAGVDIIEVHGDRLVGSLTSTLLNHREDVYGGTFENRIRFALEVVRAIKEAAPNLTIDYKLPIISTNPLRGKGGVLIEEGIELAKHLEEAGVDMLHVAQANHTGNMGDTIPAMGTQPYAFFADYAKKVKEAVSIPVSTVGRIVTPEMGEAILKAGKADIVGIGRPLLADPDWPKKAEANQMNTIRYCMMCNKGCTDSIQNRKFLSCVLNAENGYEYERMITPAVTSKCVGVIGAGPAGLEAARVAALKGHEVIVYDQNIQIGGQLQIAKVPPRKNEMNRVIQYLGASLTKLGVTLKLGKKVDATDLLRDQVEHVIVAVGASNSMPSIKGADAVHVLDAWKVLADEAICAGKVVVIGGGLVGAETAETLAYRGCQVNIVEMMDEIAKEESTTVRPVLFDSFKAHHVGLYTGYTVVEITPQVVYAQNKDKEIIEIPCDYVVMAVGAKPNKFDQEPLVQAGIPVVYVGDCKEKAQDINHAICTGYDAANQIG